jgi:hypothetical protein
MPPDGPPQDRGLPPVDVHRIKAYGHEKAQSAFLGIAAVALVAGVLGVSFAHDDRMAKIGWFLGIVGLAYGAFVLFVQPQFQKKPLLELSPQGLRLRTAGEVFIPWHAVSGIDSIDLTTWPARTSPFPVKFENVTTVQVRRDFYDRSIVPTISRWPGPAQNNTFLLQGAVVQVAIHHEVLPVTVEELRREIAARWYAFRDDDAPAGPPAPSPARKVAFRVNWGKK